MSPGGDADVVVVGLGAAGGSAVLPLAEAGLKVVALEAGPRLPHGEFLFDEIGNDIRNRMGAPKANHEVPTVRPDAGSDAGKPAVAALMANAVGGAWMHAASQSWRLVPWNFESRTRLIGLRGYGAIPAGSTLLDWPLTYDELEPYYDRIETLLGVSGQAGNVQGESRGGGNPFEGSRSRDFPLPPLRRSGWNNLMAEAARSLGWHPFPVPAAVRSKPYRGMAACTYCGFCAFHDCHVGAKGTNALAGIPEAEATGNLEVVTGARVLEVMTDGDGRASGVVYVKDGHRHVQDARVVLLSSYTYENVRLLLLSRPKAFPDGLANNAGNVGRHFMAHTIKFGFGVFPGRRLNTFSGTAAQGTAVDDLDADNGDHSRPGYVGGGMLQATMELRPIQIARNTPPSVPRWGSDWKDWLARHANSIGMGILHVEQFPYEDNYLDLDPHARDREGIPLVRCTFDLKENELSAFADLERSFHDWFAEAGASESWIVDPGPLAVSTHAYGGTRMGDIGHDSVVDRWCMAHEVPNLGILGASSFPTCGSRPPTLTVQALALRSADHLVANWGAITG
jgi:gluconate 2-dehydrogenase alpha chain